MSKREFRFFWEAPKERDAGIEAETRTEVTIPVHVAETEKAVIVRAELKGFRKENIQINTAESFIEIAASGSFEKTKETKTSYVHEKKSGSIRRAFTLPAKVDPDKAEAKFENGILTVSLPKAGKAEKKRRKLEIR